MSQFDPDEVMTEDPGIKVELTTEADLYCLRVTIGEQVILMHTKSAIDLQRKLGLAIMDWVGEAATTIIQWELKHS